MSRNRYIGIGSLRNAIIQKFSKVKEMGEIMLTSKIVPKSRHFCSLAILAILMSSFTSIRAEERPEQAAASNQNEIPENRLAKEKLESQIKNVRFKDSRFGEAISFIRENNNINIVVDPKCIPGKDYQVSFEAESAKLKTVLRSILRNANATYSIRNGSIFIYSADYSEPSVLMIYDTRDLLIETSCHVKNLFNSKDESRTCEIRDGKLFAMQPPGIHVLISSIISDARRKLHMQQ